MAMLLYERQYQLHIILGNQKSPSLWMPQGWRNIEKDLQKISEASRGATSLSSLQYVPDGEHMREAKFGRMSLSPNSYKKWVHDYGNFPERKQWKFHSVEMWSPGRTTCAKENLAPDFVFGIVNEDYYLRPQLVTFNPFVVVAGALDKGVEFVAKVDSLAAKLAKQTECVLHITKASAWGREYLSGHTDAIGDLLACSPFKPALAHADVPFIDRISDYWK